MLKQELKNTCSVPIGTQIQFLLWQWKVQVEKNMG